MSPARRSTLKDVAQAAEVSITTASVVLNGKRQGIRVPEVTRERVRKAAAELDYRPNQMARGLRQQTSTAIGFLSDRVTTTPFAVAMLAAAQEKAAARGYLLFVVNVADAEGVIRLEPALDQLVQHQVSTFVVASMHHTGVEPAPDLPASTVFVNSFATSGPYTSIVPDERGAANAAVSELLQAGHRRVAFLNDNSGTLAAPLRHEGYVDAHRALGIEPDPELHVLVPPATRGGMLGGELLDLPAERRPTAVFCFNDRAATGLYRAAARRGLRIPEDLSVIGFDDQEFIASELDPPLTTMRLPHEEMGQLAIEVVLDHDAADVDWQPFGDGGRITLVTCPIVRRDSVAPPRVDT